MSMIAQRIKSFTLWEFVRQIFLPLSLIGVALVSGYLEVVRYGALS
jgi:hypothetical protein